MFLPLKYLARYLVIFIIPAFVALYSIGDTMLVLE